MKNAVFWDMAPCRYFVKRRFGGTYHLHLTVWLSAPAHARSSLAVVLFFSNLKMEAIRSSETSVNTMSTRRHIPQDGFLQAIINTILLIFLSYEMDFTYVYFKEYNFFIRLRLVIFNLHIPKSSQIFCKVSPIFRPDTPCRFLYYYMMVVLFCSS
jgi:hypothetical protein